MSACRPAIDEALLHALVDGRLDPAQLAEVTAWLQAHPDDARRVADWRRQNELIEGLWSDVALQPVPASLRLQGLMRRGWRRPLAGLAAALALLVAGLAGGWALRGAIVPPGDPLAELAGGALAAHRLYVAEKRHAVEVDRSEEEHLLTWLSRRLDRPLKAPNLAEAGLQLLGGRLLPTGSGEPAAQLMYEDPTGARYTLFVARGHGREAAFRIAEQDGATAFYWVDADTAYALIGSGPRDRLLAIAREVHDQLGAPAG